MEKLKISLITLLCISFFIHSCTKENIVNQSNSKTLKSSSQVENLNHLNNVLADPPTNSLITSKYSLDLSNVSGVYNFDHNTGNTLMNEYVFTIPATLLNNSDNTIVSTNIIVVCILNEGKAIVFEDTKRSIANGNFSKKLNLLGNPSSEEFGYIVNNSDIIIQAFPCGGLNSWWDCMKCAYADYTSNLIGQITWVPTGCSLAAAFCALMPTPYIAYTMPT